MLWSQARGICICDNVGIATSSRDRTIRFWTLDELNNRDYTLSKILLGHTSFVGPLAWIPPNDEFPEGGLVSGGMDTLVLVWNLATGEKAHVLKGHKLQVTGVAVDGSEIVSTSVDWYVVIYYTFSYGLIDFFWGELSLLKFENDQLKGQIYNARPRSLSWCHW